MPKNNSGPQWEMLVLTYVELNEATPAAWLAKSTTPSLPNGKTTDDRSTDGYDWHSPTDEYAKGEDGQMAHTSWQSGTVVRIK
jgi:hypothetical protein